MNQYLTPGIYIKHHTAIETKSIKNFASLFLSFALKESSKPIVLNSLSEIAKFDFLRDDLLITKAIKVFFENGGKKLYLLSLLQNGIFDINGFQKLLSKNCDSLIDLETIVAVDIFDSQFYNKIVSERETILLQNEISKYSKNSFRISISDLPMEYSSEYLNGLYETIIYYPWIINSQNSKIPPSIYAVSLFSKVALDDGVYVSIANRELKNAIDTTKKLNKNEIEELYKSEINPIIRNINDGVKIWGVKTFNSHIKVVNTLRVLNYIKRNIQHIAKWYIFEPNDEYLKEKLTRDFDNFLFELWQEGSLKGEASEEAYQIICDERNNTIEDYQKGRLNIDVAISITKPLEFILINLNRVQNDGNQATINIS